MLIVDSNTATARHVNVNVESHILKGRRLILTFLSVKLFGCASGLHLNHSW